MPKPTIRSTKEFEVVLKTLCLDLASANDHYGLYRKLLAAKEDRYAKALSQSQTFWSLTYGAHFDAAVFRLCRAYDQDPDALALLGFVSAIKAQPAFLPAPQMLNPLNAEQLEKDLAWVNRETNPAVEHLMMWRHKVYAHRDIRKHLAGNLSVEHPVTRDDVAALLENGFDIVNRYNGVFFGAFFARETHGLEDYELVLRTLQDRVELWEAKFEAERQRVMRESQDS